MKGENHLTHPLSQIPGYATETFVILKVWRYSLPLWWLHNAQTQDVKFV